MSLLEWMISLCLASTLGWMGWKSYDIHQHAVYTLSTPLTESFEMPWIETLLRDQIRHAGFTPCGAVERLTPFLHAYVLQTAPRLSLTLFRMEKDYIQVRMHDRQHLELSTPQILKPETDYLIADCYHAEVFQMHSPFQMHLSAVQLSSPLTFKYYPPVFLGKWLKTTFVFDTSKHQLMYQSHGHQEMLSSRFKQMDIAPLPPSLSTPGLRIHATTQSGQQHEWITAFRTLG